MSATFQSLPKISEATANVVLSFVTNVAKCGWFWNLSISHVWGLGNRKITCFFASLKLIHHIEMHLVDAPSVLKIEILEIRKKKWFDFIIVSGTGISANWEMTFAGKIIALSLPVGSFLQCTDDQDRFFRGKFNFMWLWAYYIQFSISFDKKILNVLHLIGELALKLLKQLLQCLEISWKQTFGFFLWKWGLKYAVQSKMSGFRTRVMVIMTTVMNAECRVHSLYFQRKPFKEQGDFGFEFSWIDSLK